MMSSIEQTGQPLISALRRAAGGFSLAEHIDGLEKGWPERNVQRG